MYLLTSARHYDSHYELLVELEYFSGSHLYAHYDCFRVDSRANGYQLHISGYSGTSGDSMTILDGLMFSAPDLDQDDSEKYHCGSIFESSFWYKSCVQSNLNGQYRDAVSEEWGMAWYKWEGEGNRLSLKFTEMKIRRKAGYCPAPPVEQENHSARLSLWVQLSAWAMGAILLALHRL